jgi:glutamate-ammonia-ligase adenylyltransferase
VLNTPERIDVIEQMGHLTSQEASFLRTAATFFRAVDHAQRVSSGHAEGSLPASQSQVEVLTNLVNRWTPACGDVTLENALRQIQRRTREFFVHLFGENGDR